MTIWGQPLIVFLFLGLALYWLWKSWGLFRARRRKSQPSPHIWKHLIFPPSAVILIALSVLLSLSQLWSLYRHGERNDTVVAVAAALLCLALVRILWKFAVPIAAFIVDLVTTPLHRKDTPMEQEPLKELKEQVIQVRELYPELNLSQVPRLAVERRSWLEALQERIQYTRDMRTTDVATAALESKLAYIRRLVELEELGTKKEQSGLTREQIRVDKDLLAKRKETELAKIEADTEEHILRKAQAQKAIGDLKNPPKPEPQQPSTPPRDRWVDEIAQKFRKVEQVAEVEKQRSAWKVTHPDLSDYIDRIADDNIERIKGDHRS